MDILTFDRAHLWHPYAPIVNPPPVSVATECHDSRIVLADGTELIDAVASWWCVAHGHRNPRIVEAIRKQAEKMPHVMFAGFTHEPAVTLAEKLTSMTPAGLNRVFFADSGSIAVECAAKLAVQYQHNTGHPERTRLISLRGAYHGDTAGAMALSDPDGMHALFAGIMPHHVFADQPAKKFESEFEFESKTTAINPDVDFASLRETVAAHAHEAAAIFCEPIFQGGNAMWLYHAAYLKEIRRLCDEYGLLMVADEIAAGFHRTGPRWACEHAGVVPDMMCVGKALTGGHITLAALVAHERVADAVSAGDPPAFMHGPTYMANPIACAAGVASLSLFEESDYTAKATHIDGTLHERLDGLRGKENIQDVRILGGIGVVELDAMPAVTDIARVVRETGVWLRPFGNWVYTMPSLTIDDADLHRVCDAITAVSALPPMEHALGTNGGFHE